MNLADVISLIRERRASPVTDWHDVTISGRETVDVVRCLEDAEKLIRDLRKTIGRLRSENTDMREELDGGDGKSGGSAEWSV